ncbi:Translation elongation factor P Lys34--(R)-beta-lysine ligase [hydrothermal vent metagenome]|uniref:Translation elongation factor P Lys34--(R)-beta-lysine ligase n=1 Tax=hydrothermal vent metagenome TaxID=652676 RepID=A0A3B0X9X7_9ZZZZ
MSFELFFGELELANGFYELTNAQEQLQRFQKDNEIREQRKQKVMPIDMDLIDALAVGLPNCSGVAIGIDRVLMLVLGAEHIRDVIGFGDEFF